MAEAADTTSDWLNRPDQLISTGQGRNSWKKAGYWPEFEYLDNIATSRHGWMFGSQYIIAS